MLIDWFTVIAQVINFLILVWLLKRFLYRPILDAIDAREKRIATELADADAKKVEAQQECDAFQHKNEEFDRQRAALLSKAADEANAERQRLLDEARKAADALSARRQETLRNDAHNLNQAISRRTQQEVFAIARKALRPRGTLVMKSTYAGNLNVNASSLVVDEITLVGSRCGPFAPALALLAEHKVDVRPLIHATYSLDDSVQAFEYAQRRGTMKVLIRVS